MIAVQQARQLEDVLPIVPLDFGARVAANQHQLQRSGIVDVQRDVDQVLAGPPAHDRGGEGIRAGREEGDPADDRHEHLCKTAPKRCHQIAERQEEYVAGFVKRNANQVEE